MSSNHDYERLEKLYYNRIEPTAFRGIQPLVRSVHMDIDRKKVEDWASSQDTYTLFKPKRKKYPRNYYLVTHINDLWESDLVDLQKLKNDNNGVKFLLTTIDVFSKKAYVIPLKDKSAKSIIKAYQELFQHIGIKPNKLRTDKGKEFTAKTVEKFFKDNKINHFTVKNPDIKAAVVERFNRTLKERMWRYLHYINSHRYIDGLEDLVAAYNNSYHSTIKMSPSEVRDTNSLQVFHNIYDKKISKKIIPRLKEGDFVRIAREKGIFEKGYEYSFSEEIFIIDKIIRHGVPVYQIKDLNNEIIDGYFYEAELQKVQFDPNAEFKIDKILETKGKGSRKKVLVSWRGYPSAFSSWVSEKELKLL